MKKFKQFFCVSLLVVFTLTMLTLPAAASAFKVIMPDQSTPAASMTFNLTYGDFGPVQVKTDAKGVFQCPAELKNYAENAAKKSKHYMGQFKLTTSSPSMMLSEIPLDVMHVLNDSPNAEFKILLYPDPDDPNAPRRKRGK